MTDQLQNIEEDNSNPSDSQIKRRNYSNLIKSTCEMMLGQIHANLDYNLVNMNMFQPKTGEYRLFSQVLIPVISMFHLQA